MLKLPQFKFDARTRFLACVWVFFIITVFYYRNIYLPKARYLNEVRDRYFALSDEAKRVESGIPDITAEQRKLQGLKDNYDSLLIQVVKAEKALPKNINIPDILKFLVKDKDKYKLKLFSIKARNDKMQEVPIYTPPPDSKQKAVSYYAILPIEIQMYGSYANIIEYIANLEAKSAYQRAGSLQIDMQKTLGGNPECLISVLCVLGRGEEKDEGFEAFQEALSNAEKAEDPFRKEERPRPEERLAGMQLKGIIWKAGAPHAIIGSSMYKVDDIIQGKKIIKIDKDSALLEEEDKLYRLTIKGD